MCGLARDLSETTVFPNAYPRITIVVDPRCSHELAMARGDRRLRGNVRFAGKRWSRGIPWGRCPGEGGCAVVAFPRGAQGRGLLGVRGGGLPRPHTARLERERVPEFRDRS